MQFYKYTHTHIHNNSARQLAPLHQELGYESRRVFSFYPDLRFLPTHPSPGNCSNKNGSSRQQSVSCVAVIPVACWGFSARDSMFWDERGGGFTRQPVGPFGDTSTMAIVTSTNRLDPGRFSSRCCAVRRTHTSAYLIRLLCIQLASPLTLFLPSRSAPSARPIVGVSPRTLRLAGAFMCRCKFWDKRGGLTRQSVGPLVDTPTITTVMSTNRVESGSFSSRCCAFRRTHTSVDPIRLLILYPTSFTLDSLFAFKICAQRKSHGLCLTPCPMVCGEFFLRLYVLGRAGRRTNWTTGGKWTQQSLQQ